MNEASDSRARGAARGAIARRRGVTQKGRSVGRCPLRRRARRVNAWRGAVTGRSTLVLPLVYQIDAFASRRVRAKSRGVWIGLAPSRRGGPRAIGRFVYDKGRLSYRTDRSAARHKVTHDSRATARRRAATPPRMEINYD